MDFHFMRPEWLWTLLPALAIGALLWRHRGRLGSWNQVISPDLLPYLVSPQDGSRGPNLLPILLFAWVLAAVAAAGPSWEKLPQPVHQKQDALVLILDLSYSMNSSDLAPSRVSRARQKLLDVLSMRDEGQTGLIAYAGDAHIVTPLTDDTPTIANLLPALNPDMMPVPGSDPVAAIELALELLQSAGVRGGRILLVTDGMRAIDRTAINKLLANSSTSLAVMGVGTATGAPIPLPAGGFLKDRDGTIVLPGLTEDVLADLATDTGGRFRIMQIDNGDLDYLLADPVLGSLESTVALERTADSWADQGYLLILLLLPIALALFRRGWIVCLLPVVFFAQPSATHAQSWDSLWLTPNQQGQRALAQGKAEAAAELFEDSQWQGTAAYASEDYEAAVDAFAQGEDSDAWYNRGNALARAGQLDEAIAAYQESLAQEPDRVDAQDNLALVEQLKQQQEDQQQQNQDQQQDQNEQDQQSQDQESENQQNQDQQSEEQNAQNEQDQQSEQQQNEQRQQNQQAQQGEQDGQPQQDQQQGQENEQLDSQEQTAEGSESEQERPQEATPETPQLAELDPEQQERDQAMEQWLRRVPDDPSGLLREKFRYESYQRQQRGAGKNNETYW